MTAIGPYELIGKVAQTHHSTIWRAKDPHLDRDVALKQVNRQAGEQALRQEATLLAALDHPNIVHVYDILITDTDAWLIEEWINGATLAAVRDHHGKLTTHQALAITHGALHGLAYAHHHNVIHGDISPTNILITTTGTSQLIDFGSATHSNTGAADTGTGETPTLPTSSGTGRYRSPEVANGHPATKPSDVYSTAAVLTDLLTTTTPTTTPGLTDTDNPEPPTTLDPINHVLRKALNTNPEARHPDAAALLADLQEATQRALGPAWLTLAATTGLATATLTSTAALTTETTITGTAAAGTAATTTASATTGTTPAAPITTPPHAALGTPTTTQQLHAAGDSGMRTGPPAETADIQQVSSTEPTGTGATDGSPFAGSTTSNMTQVVTRFPKKWLAIGGGAAATVAVVVTAAVVVNSSSAPNESVAAGATTAEAVNFSGSAGEDLAGSRTIQITSPNSQAATSTDPLLTSPAASASASQPASSAATASTSAGQPVAGSANPLAGTYSFVRTITNNSGNENFQIGSSESGTLTLTAACDEPTCAISSSGWGEATVNGSQLEFSGTTTEECPNIPGVAVTDAWTVTLNASDAAIADGVSRVETMQGIGTLTVTDLNGCEGSIQPITWSYDATRTS